ncbi:hypothetical protein DFJ77DRAFT_512293 [Powellomyces hirtus]|nr:hypothetical protein DFJ77DRAFT_512293 [Powellomyces hirtus]
MTLHNALDSWAADKLAEQMGLGGEDLNQIVSYLVSMSQPEEVADFLTGILGTEPTALTFIEEFNTRRFPKLKTAGAWNAPLKTPQPKPDALSPKGGYRKSAVEEAYIPGSKPVRADDSSGMLLSDKLGSAGSTSAASPVMRSAGGKKQKKGRMNVDDAAHALDDIDGMVKVGNAPPGFGGRLVCECLAATHGLITNCLNCGKIVCRLEGEGPCSSCGTPVHSARQQMTLVQTRKRENVQKSKTKAKDAYVGARYGRAAGAQIPTTFKKAAAAEVDESLFPTLMSEQDREALEKAEAQRERLLDYQRNSVARTHVHDTASDFSYEDDAANKWLSAEERALATKKAQEQRKWAEDQKRRRVITLDLKNRRVTAEVQRNPFDKTASVTETRTEALPPPIDPSSTGQFRNPTIRIAPVYIAPTKQPSTTSATTAAVTTKTPSGDDTTRIPIQRRKAQAAATSTPSHSKQQPQQQKPQPKNKRPQMRRLQHDLEGFQEDEIYEPLDQYSEPVAAM